MLLWFAEKIDHHPSATFHTLYDTIHKRIYVTCLLLLSIHERKRAQYALKMRFSWDWRVEHAVYIRTLQIRYVLGWCVQRMYVACAIYIGLTSAPYGAYLNTFIWCDVSNICYRYGTIRADVCNVCRKYGMSSPDVWNIYRGYNTYHITRSAFQDISAQLFWPIVNVKSTTRSIEGSFYVLHPAVIPTHSLPTAISFCPSFFSNPCIAGAVLVSATTPRVFPCRLWCAVLGAYVSFLRMP